MDLFTTLIGSEGRRRSREEEEEEALKRKQIQEEHLSKVCEITMLVQLIGYLCKHKHTLAVIKAIYSPLIINLKV